MRRYELTTFNSLPYQAWLVNRQEQERFTEIIRTWKKENPKANVTQQMLIESLVRLHIWEQRLCDRRVFWDGEVTDYKPQDGRMIDVSTEDLKRKTSEWEKYMPQIMRWKTELLKLALANNVSLNISGDAKNIHSLFGALDQKEREKLDAYKGKDASDDRPTT